MKFKIGDIIIRTYDTPVGLKGKLFIVTNILPHGHISIRKPDSKVEFKAPNCDWHEDYFKPYGDKVIIDGEEYI